MNLPTRLARAALTVGLILVGSGCTSEQLLHADFEADAPRSFPDLALPGAPDGDRMSWAGPRTGTNGGKPPLEVREIGGSHWLDYYIVAPVDAPAGTVPGTLLGFHPRPATSPEGVYTIQWKGFISYGPSASPARLDLGIRVVSGEGHGGPALVRLLIRPTPGVAGEASGFRPTVYLAQGDREEQIGFLRDEREHSLTLLISAETRKYSVLGPGISVTRDLPEGVAVRPPSVFFNFFGYPGFTAYRIDEMTIVRGERTP